MIQLCYVGCRRKSPQVRCSNRRGSGRADSSTRELGNRATSCKKCRKFSLRNYMIRGNSASSNSSCLSYGRYRPNFLDGDEAASIMWFSICVDSSYFRVWPRNIIKLRDNKLREEERRKQTESSHVMVYPGKILEKRDHERLDNYICLRIELISFYLRFAYAFQSLST